MAALTQATQRTLETGDYKSPKVGAAKHVRSGAWVGRASGYAQPLVAGNVLIGLARRSTNNSAGAAGDLRARVLVRGEVRGLVTGVVDENDIGKPVWLANDNDLTLTKGSNSFLGHITEWHGGTDCTIAWSSHFPSAAIADPTGGATVDAESRTAIGAIIDCLQEHGLCL